MSLRKIGIIFSGLAYGAAVVVLLLGLRGVMGGLGSNGFLPIVMLLLLSIIVVAGLVFLSGLAQKITRRGYILLLVSMVLVSLSTSIVVLLSVVSRNVGWDPGVLFGFAIEYVDGTGYHGERYLTRYGNNALMALIIIVIAQVAEFVRIDPYLLAAIINSLLLFASSLLIMYGAHRLFGRRGVVVVWALSLIMINLSPWVATFYSDTVGLFFVAAIIVLFLKIGDSTTKRSVWLWTILLGVCAAVGFLIKPTVAILPIGLALSYGLGIIFGKKKLTRNVLVLTGAVLMIFMLIVGGFKAFVNSRIVNNSHMIEAVQLSTDHFLAMGSLRGLPPYTMCRMGGYCNELIHDLDTREDLRTLAERKEYHTQLLMDSIMTDFPVGYGSFVVNKLSSSFGDGSFLVWREGSSEPEYLVRWGVIKLPHQFLSRKGRFIGVSRYMWQVVWVAMIFLMMIAISSELRNSVKRRKVSLWVLGLAITIIGLACYQVMFESRSRYLFLYLPVFILLASWGVYTLERRVRQLRRSR